MNVKLNDNVLVIATSYSKLEGQLRNATDKEIYVIAKILNVSIETLFSDAEKVLDK